MELFRAQPDLSLQISPPKSTPTDHESNLGFWRRALDTNSPHLSSPKPGLGAAGDFHLSLANPNSLNYSNSTYHQQHFLLHSQPILPDGYNNNQLDLSFMKPIRGIPVYHTASPPSSFPSFVHNPQNLCESNNAMCTIQGVRSPRLLSRVPPKRSVRAPRMRWTTSLHARFVHAVELLGGHERATPKSVLELMDVKDLTLAHVKSHLQMYRTIKTTDHKPATSGQAKPAENSDDNLLDINNSNNNGSESSIQQGRNGGTDLNGLWCNSSSRVAWFHDKPTDFNQRSINSFQEIESRNFEDTTNVTKKPNLEFTLGRPH